MPTPHSEKFLNFEQHEYLQSITLNLAKLKILYLCVDQEFGAVVGVALFRWCKKHVESEQVLFHKT